VEPLGDIGTFLIAQAEGGGDEGGSFLVSPALGLMFWTLLAFGVTMFVLSKLAFPRIGEALEKRANAIRENIEASERQREEAEKLLEEYRQRLREAVRLCVRLLGDPAFQAILEHRVSPTDAELASDAALDRWLLQTVTTSYHVSGTCKMGPDADPMAVVDQYCNVKGVQGLSVVDASIMPRIPRSGGCHATVLMIGERAVAFIEAALRQPTGV